MQNLQGKAEERNPDEFYFAMQKQSTKDGVHVARSVPCHSVLHSFLPKSHIASKGFSV